MGNSSIAWKVTGLNKEVGKMENHDNQCNCEDCWWANDQQETCATCETLDCDHISFEDARKESVERYGKAYKKLADQ